MRRLLRVAADSFGVMGLRLTMAGIPMIGSFHRGIGISEKIYFDREKAAGD